MVENRKNPRLQISQYPGYSIRIIPTKSQELSFRMDILNLSEEGCSVHSENGDIPLDIADSLKGFLEDRSGKNLVRFTGYVVWKQENRLGICFHREISIPEQIIALEMSLIE